MKINLEVGDPEFDRSSPCSFADAIIATVYKLEPDKDMALTFVDEIKGHLSVYVINEKIRQRTAKLEDNKGDD